MRFLEVNLIDNKNSMEKPFWLAVDKIVGITEIEVPGELSGPTGTPLPKKGSLIDLGNKIIMVKETPEYLFKILSENF